jgi:glyoxylase-like metal-dependent hydrolase (beta-lactamase superfamily II)
LIELAANIFYIPGKNNSRFPYCACLYLRGKKLRVLIDAGMGAENLAPVKEMGIDLLILTHCHIDHRLTRREVIDIPVWCHESEAIFLKNHEHFFTAMGLRRSGLDLIGLFKSDPAILHIEIDHLLTDGEPIDLGGLTL